MPTQIHEQLIGLKRTPRVAPRAHQGPGVCSADAVIARAGRNRVRFAIGRFALRFRGLTAEPESSLVPRSRLERGRTSKNAASEPQQGTEVAVVARRQRKYAAAVIRAMIGRVPDPWTQNSP